MSKFVKFLMIASDDLQYIFYNIHHKYCENMNEMIMFVPITC